jgi:hypothetical protein
VTSPFWDEVVWLVFWEKAVGQVLGFHAADWSDPRKAIL